RRAISAGLAGVRAVAGGVELRRTRCAVFSVAGGPDDDRLLPRRRAHQASDQPELTRRGRRSQVARSASSRCTAAVIALVKGTSWWIASTRNTPALRSAVASSLPTSRSPYRIGSAQ